MFCIVVVVVATQSLCSQNNWLTIMLGWPWVSYWLSFSSIVSCHCVCKLETSVTLQPLCTGNNVPFSLFSQNNAALLLFLQNNGPVITRRRITYPRHHSRRITQHCCYSWRITARFNYAGSVMIWSKNNIYIILRPDQPHSLACHKRCLHRVCVALTYDPTEVKHIPSYFTECAWLLHS